MEKAICAKCVHYPWRRDADPSMLSVMACHPQLRSNRWTSESRDMERECALYQDMDAVEIEAAPEAKPAPPVSTPVAGSEGAQGNPDSGNLTIPPAPDVTTQGRLPNGNPLPGLTTNDLVHRGPTPDPVPIGTHKGATPEPVPLANAPVESAPKITATDAELEAMKYQDLVSYARKHDLDTSGKHPDVLARVKAAR